MLSLAFVNTSRNEGAESAGRSSLIERIEARRAAVDQLQGEIARLRRQNAELAQRVTELTADRQGALAELEQMQVRTGFVPVFGPGVRITVEATRDDPNQVQDSDLAMLVNGLWSAGAEAISVNDHRLTARSAIRTSGTAIEVNSSGIAPPYTVQAIGPESMWADFFERSSGLAFDALAREWHFTYDIQPETDLTLPAAPRRLRTLRNAREGSGSDLPGGSLRGDTES
jgi:uncharacterized protein YlxW (UPF0749 family)